MSREHADIARRAAEIVQTKGLCKGLSFDDEGRVCMWGALHEASEEMTGSVGVLYRSGSVGPVFVAIADRLGLHPGPFVGAKAFNDLPETDEKDVAKFLMSVADDLELA
jgi:hypothetical protein